MMENDEKYMKERIRDILDEDVRRRLSREEAYDPIKGVGSIGPRRLTLSPFGDEPDAFLPLSMLGDNAYGSCRRDLASWRKLRCRHDFEYWCATCVKIHDKLTRRVAPLILNRPQRRVAAILEADRLAGKPLRLIMLKARQWGGSTLVQMYMAWIQTCLRRNWNSLICAHVKDAAGTIRGMYTTMLESYPEELWQGDDGEKPAFKPYERSQNIRQIPGRGCRVTIGSSESPEAIRGSDISMAHLSETAFWCDTTKNSPENFIRAICGGVVLEPLTLIAIESTANGVGNYFHREWERNKRGEGDKHAVFVPWYEIDIYRLPPSDPEAVASLVLSDSYCAMLWNKGCALDQINWYVRKAKEYSSREQLQAEFPTTDVEAFVNSSSGVFGSPGVEALRQCCREPEAVGEVDSVGRFVAEPTGRMRLWSYPERGRSYVAAVDVGGRSDRADWSVVAVLALAGGVDEPMETVAQWRGHIDHDLLVDKARGIASFYNNALLVIESNTLESDRYAYGCEAPSDSQMFVLARLAEVYPNLYRRRQYDAVNGGMTYKYGFHTNRSTKPMLIDNLIKAVREGLYIERDSMACDEYLTYERRQNGSYGAKAGCHDDILMTRAMAIFAAWEERGSDAGALDPQLLNWKSRQGW